MTCNGYAKLACPLTENCGITVGPLGDLLRSFPKDPIKFQSKTNNMETPC